MPERPDLEYVVPKLGRLLRGHTILSAQVHSPVVMRLMVPGAADTLLTGSCVEKVVRRAHFVHFKLSGAVDLVVSPMLAGRFDWVPKGTRRRKDVALVLELEGGLLRYRDDVQMGKVYLATTQQLKKIPGFEKIGVDVLSRRFTPERLAELARGKRQQVKLFLMDKSVLDAMGNAYADEVLFAAGIHPKSRVSELSEQQLGVLHGAIVETLKDARQRIRKAKPPLDTKLRDFLKVRNRKGQPCPVCGSSIRAAGVRGHDAFFCPQCQPDGKGRGFVNWRALGPGGPRGTEK